MSMKPKAVMTPAVKPNRVDSLHPHSGLKTVGKAPTRVTKASSFQDGSQQAEFRKKNIAHDDRMAGIPRFGAVAPKFAPQTDVAKTFAFALMEGKKGVEDLANALINSMTS